MRLVLAISLLLTNVAQAEIYKTYDKNGNVIFSDVPSDSAEKVEEKQIMTVPALPAALKKPLTTNSTNKDSIIPKGYKIVISGLDAQATIQKQSPAFNIGLSFDPPLHTTHTLEVLLDSRNLGKNNFAPKIDPSQLDRGQHRLEVKVLDQKQKIIQTESVDFFIQQASAAGKR